MTRDYGFDSTGTAAYQRFVQPIQTEKLAEIFFLPTWDI